MNQNGWFKSMDRQRRRRGMLLELAGFGPRESEYHIILSHECFRLRCYGTGPPSGSPLLLVPAPIKRPYIWDLSPERSVVRQALRRGRAVYMIEWTDPDEQKMAPGLADYAGTMLEHCTRAATRHSGAGTVFLAGHSLGGVLASLYGAYRPSHLAGLIIIDAPLNFNGAQGEFSTSLAMDLPAKSILPAARTIPGSLLSMISARSAPRTFCIDRYVDRLASATSPERLKTHWQVERWTLDEMPMPRKLFEDVVEQLFRRNKFMRGQIMFGETQLHPAAIKAPLLVVYEASSRIIPAESVTVFPLAAGSTQKELIPYPGDTGVALQHVGALVGDNAHRVTWPHICAWMERIDQANYAAAPIRQQS